MTRNFAPTAATAMVFVAACFTISCSRPEKIEATVSAKDPTPAPTVPIAEASLTPMSHGEVLTAEFRPFQEIEVMAKVAGYVKKINVDVGDRVKQGQVLAELEIPEMADDVVRANAAVARAQ